MTPSDVITDVKRLIQDNPLMRMPETYIAATLLEFVNMTLRRIVSFRPDEFAYHDAALATTTGSIYQTLPSTGVRVIEIFGATLSGTASAVVEVDRETMDRTNPEWQAASSGTPVNWCRHPRNPRAFFLYPPPASGVTLRAEYVKAPSTLAVGDTIALLPDSYLPIIVDGVAFMAESVYNGSPGDRAKMFYESFIQGLKASAGTRGVVDDEKSGIESSTK